MKTSTFDTQEIQITSVYFRKNGDAVRFESYPRQLTYKGRQYLLADS